MNKLSINLCKKSLKIPKGQSESVYRRRTDNTMAKRTKYSITNNDLQNITQKIKDEPTLIMYNVHHPYWCRAKHRMTELKTPFTGPYQDFFDMGLLRTKKLLNQVITSTILRSSL